MLGDCGLAILHILPDVVVVVVVGELVDLCHGVSVTRLAVDGVRRRLGGIGGGLRRILLRGRLMGALLRLPGAASAGGHQRAGSASVG